MAELLVIVVNYKTPALTMACVRSLASARANLPGLRVVVVENCSGDGSGEAIEAGIAAEGFGEWVRLVRSSDNGGFAAGNNVGWRADGPAEFVLLLNSDTVVHAGAIEQSLATMASDSTIGAFSCRLLNGDGTLQNVARGFPTPARLVLSALGLPWRVPWLFGWADPEQPWWDREVEKRDVDWLGGAYLMLRGDMIPTSGPLDSDFFFYGEDIEVCHRVWRAGKRCVYDPRFTVTHLGGSSSDPARMSAMTRSVHVWRGRYLVQRKCYGRWAEVLVRAVDTIVCAGRVGVLRLLGRGGGQRCKDQQAALGLLCGRLMGSRT